MWSADSIADLLAAALAEREHALREEQAVYGLDSLDELDLHPLLTTAFSSAGFGVLREQPYPTQWKRKHAGAADLPLPRDRERCDLVLTPRPAQQLVDSLTTAKTAQTIQRQGAGTLFESAAQRDAALVSHSDTAVAPDDAYWLEVKLVAQYSVESGVPGPNRSYASQLTRFAAADVGKLSCDRTIVHGSLALILFTADEPTAHHDSNALLDRLITRGLRVTSPIRRSLPILDRIGNALCSIILIPLRPAPPLDE